MGVSSHALRGSCVAALAAALLWPLAAAAQSATPLPPRFIAVSGEGRASTLPDRAQLSMAVEVVEPQLKTAEDEVARVVHEFLGAARELGLADEDLSTGAVSVRPEYVWDEQTRQQKRVGYRVRRGIQARLAQIDQLGELLVAATRAGVNEISPPRLESSRARELRHEAMVRATRDARDKARLLAEALDVELGGVLRLDASDGGAAPPTPMYEVARAAADAKSGNADMAINTGEIEFRATVQAHFEIRP